MRERDGTVWCWGSGSYGRLGNGSTNNEQVPARVMGVTGATQIAVGFAHGCAVLQDKTVACWGRGGEVDRGTVFANSTLRALDRRGANSQGG